MKVVEGKFYRTSTGQKIGPMKDFGVWGAKTHYIHQSGDGCVWGECGKATTDIALERYGDIVSVWAEVIVSEQMLDEEV